MIKISSQFLLIFSPAWIFLISCLILYLILYQSVSFFIGLLILSFLFFLTIWRNFLRIRRIGELAGLKSKKQIFIISLIFTLGFIELIWVVSFLPFSFFILSGILAVIFGATLDIYREYFKKTADNNLEMNKVLIRDIAAGVTLIVIFIFINPWLPPKAS